MQIRIVVATALLLTCAMAPAEFRTKKLAYEVPLSVFVAPVTTSGNLNFRECESCEINSARLTSDTRFVINKQDVPLPEFRSRISLVRDRNNHTLTVLEDLASNTVTSVSIKL